MKVLGVAYEHNATVCLMEDGEVTFCQSEERLNRIKNSDGFPYETLKYVYEHLCSPQSIDLEVLYETSINGYLCLKNGNLNSHVPAFEEFRNAPKHSRLRQRFARTDLATRYKASPLREQPEFIKRSGSLFCRSPWLGSLKDKASGPSPLSRIQRYPKCLEMG
jgi:predicted NodU family carbamoyl transferase